MTLADYIEQSRRHTSRLVSRRKRRERMLRASRIARMVRSIAC